MEDANINAQQPQTCVLVHHRHTLLLRYSTLEMLLDHRRRKLP